MSANTFKILKDLKIFILVYLKKDEYKKISDSLFKPNEDKQI